LSHIYKNDTTTFILFNAMKYLTIVLMIGFWNLSHAAFEKTESGAAVMALGNAAVAIPDLKNALFTNPANISSPTTISAEFSYRTFFGLSEIGQTDLIINTSFWNQPLSIGINRYGTSGYQELHISGGSSMALFDGFRIGMSFSSYFLSIRGYGDDNTIGIHLGIQYKLSDIIHCGVMISNINKPKISRVSEKLPQSISLGFCFTPIRGLLIATEIFRDIRFEPDYRLGIAYKTDYPIIIRIGLQDTVNSYCLGFGTYFKSLYFDYALQVQQSVGISHTMSISVEW